jgi:CheY-like chemotaxis protein
LNLQVQQARKLLERTIPRMINIKLNLSEDLHTVNADPAQIEQIIINLAINSRDAIKSSGEIRIETKNLDLDEEYCEIHVGFEPGVYVLLTISDTGHGMNAETLKQIFDPFFTTKEPGKGTGLGLSSVYGIVKSHNGHILCYSEVGMGTSFKIYFPTIEASSDYLIEKKEELPLLGGSETILIVDDEQMILEMSSEILKRGNYHVIRASSGEDAIKLYQKKQSEIDLVILDLNMPGIGGEKCLKELLNMDPKVKVIVSSGYSLNGSSGVALNLGAKDFISKPYRMRDLLRTVRGVLDGH